MKNIESILLAEKNRVIFYLLKMFGKMTEKQLAAKLKRVNIFTNRWSFQTNTGSTPDWSKISKPLCDEFKITDEKKLARKCKEYSKLLKDYRNINAMLKTHYMPH